MTPQASFAYINEFFALAGPAVREHDGFIMKYMGDGFMALFGLDDPRSAALAAVRAGLDMLGAMARLAPYLESICGRSLQLGIGIHLGEAVVGTVGAARFQRLTAIGDAVNLASRIETENRAAGTQFLVSQAVFDEVKDHIAAAERCQRVTIKGKTGEFTLFEVLGLK